MPSVSAPNWSTTICGMGPSESGIQSNSWVPTDDAPPNIIVEEMPPISGANKVYSHISSLMAFDEKPLFHGNMHMTILRLQS